MIELEPATSAVRHLLANLDDDALDAPTPCGDTTVAGLVDHLNGLAFAFAAAARKQPVAGGPGPQPGADLPADWRTTVPASLDALADAWRDPAAWTGMTAVGGVDLPGEVAGLVALNEVVVHGWDLAVATGQDYHPPAEQVAGADEYVASVAAEHPEGVPGLFGPVVPVPEDAPPLDRLLGRAGRSPNWRPAGE